MFDALKTSLLTLWNTLKVSSPKIDKAMGKVNLGSKIIEKFCKVHPKWILKSGICYICQPCKDCVAIGKDKTWHAPGSSKCTSTNPENAPDDTSKKSPQEESGFKGKAHLASKIPNAVIDSGASHHMLRNKDGFDLYSISKQGLVTADGNILETVGTGTVPVNTKNGKATLRNVLHTPGLSEEGLLSVHQFDAAGYGSVIFGGKYYLIPNASLEQYDSLMTPDLF